MLSVTAVEARPTRPQSLPTPLGDLPANSPVAFFTSRLGDVINDLREYRLVFNQVGEGLRDLCPRALLSRLLWGVDESHSPSEEEMEHGLDLDGSAAVHLHPDLSAAVFVIPLLQPSQFREWLGSITAPSRLQYTIKGTPVLALGSDTALPLACAVRGTRAICQLGTPTRGNQELLSDFLRPQGPRLNDVTSLVHAWRALPEQTHVSAVVRPRQLVRGLVQAWGRSMLHTHRLRDAQHLRNLARSIHLLEHRMISHTAFLEAVALGVETTKIGQRMELIAQLSVRGARRFAGWRPGGASRRRILRWLSTPALFKAFIQTEPKAMADVLKHLGLKLPAEAVDGSFGLMTVGVDTGGKHVPSSGKERDWVHLFPSAVSIGLRGPAAADFIHTQLRRQFKVDASHQTKAENRTPLVSRPNGGHFEVRILDDLLIAATGPLGGYSAIRRLRQNDVSSSGHAAGFLFAVIDFGLVNAALDGTLDTTRQRAELQWVDAVRQRLAPAFPQLRRIELSGFIEENGRRIRLGLATGR